MNARDMEAALVALGDLLPNGESNGSYTASLAGALRLMGKPLDDYTVGELRLIVETHYATWQQDFRYFSYYVGAIDAGRNPMPPEVWEQLNNTRAIQ